MIGSVGLQFVGFEVGVSSVVVVFVVLLSCGVMGLCVAAWRRKRMSFPRYRRLVGVSTFTVFVGVWGAVIGGMFWVTA